MTEIRRRWNDDTTIEDLRAEFAPYVDRIGYRFNEDAGFVEDVLEGVLANLDRAGDTYCPCRIRTGDFREDAKIICPCIAAHREEFAVMGKCWCGLFVRQDSEDDSALMGAIREAAPGEEIEVPVMRFEDLCDHTVRPFEIGNRKLAIARIGDEVFATAGICRHAGGPLGQGFVDGEDVVCPLHGWRFNVRDGSTDHPGSDIKVFPASVKDGVVYITIAIDA